MDGKWNEYSHVANEEEYREIQVEMLGVCAK